MTQETHTRIHYKTHAYSRDAIALDSTTVATTRTNAQSYPFFNYTAALTVEPSATTRILFFQLARAKVDDQGLGAKIDARARRVPTRVPAKPSDAER